jgi:hypothetical protein
MIPWRRRLLGCALWLLGAGQLAWSAHAPEASAAAWSGPHIAGPLAATPNQEASGLAASRLTPGLLWTHDDSGGAPELYAIDSKGQRRGTVRVAGVTNKDWEDLAAFRRDGRAWLLVADVGDNDAKRSTVRLHLLPEPSAQELRPTATPTIQPEYTLRVRYEDGPRDCEAVAVDPRGGTIYLLSKRDAPARLYQLPLARAEGVVTARFVATVPTLEGTTEVDFFLKRLLGRKLNWPTAMDFRADGKAILVLTYGAALVFARQDNEAWPEAFRREPVRLPFHGLRQAEGACFSLDGRSVFIVSEGNSDLVRYDQKLP